MAELERLRARIGAGYNIANDPYIGGDIAWAVGEIGRLQERINYLLNTEPSEWEPEAIRWPRSEPREVDSP